MQYLGGKRRISRELAEALLRNTEKRGHLVEPFVGGASMTVALAPHFESITASDARPDLIALLDAVARGWRPPMQVSEQDYRAAQEAAPSALRGFIGFGCSHSGKFFGGFARGAIGRNYAAGAARALLTDAPFLRQIEFACHDYRAADVRAGDVVYCDPPYAGATGYGVPFDTQEFFAIAAAWAKAGADVFVSEYSAPAPWECMWSTERDQGLRFRDAARSRQVVERLFRLTEKGIDTGGPTRDNRVGL